MRRRLPASLSAVFVVAVTAATAFVAPAVDAGERREDACEDRCDERRDECESKAEAAAHECVRKIEADSEWEW